MTKSKIETPEEGASRLTRKQQRQGFAREALHAYHDADSNPAFYRIRMRHSDGRKQIRPMTLINGRFELCEPLKAARGGLIYRLPDILSSPEAVVWIVEGESCADALAQLGMIATTSGCATSAALADWSPLEARTCVVWPDNDAPGRTYAREVATRLRAIGCDPETVDVGGLGLPEAGDCVDWLSMNPNASVSDVGALPRPKAAVINGADILDAVHGYLARFVAYPSEAAHVAHTLWIAHTHLMDAWDTTPRLAFMSAEPGSGKSRALEVTAPLVPRALHSISMSPASVFRSISSPAGPPAIVNYEIDTIFGALANGNEDLRALINGGHHRGAVVTRVTARDDEFAVEEFSSFCAVALAGIGKLPETIRTRAISINMRKRAPNEEVEQFRFRMEHAQAIPIGEHLAQWADRIRESLHGTYPNLPDGIRDRDADVWDPLLRVADAAGGTWPDRSRVAAVALVADSGERVPSLGVQLLSDLRQVFGESDTLPTRTILDRLTAMEESPWASLKGRPLDARGLSNLLRGYAIHPTTIRIGVETLRGYRRVDLMDAWSRYLIPLPPEAATSATSATLAPRPQPEIGQIGEKNRT
jgi:hypothetical protein